MASANDIYISRFDGLKWAENLGIFTISSAGEVQVVLSSQSYIIRSDSSFPFIVRTVANSNLAYIESSGKLTLAGGLTINGTISGASTITTNTSGRVSSDFFTDTTNTQAYFSTVASGIGWQLINRIAASIVLVVKGASSQSANLQEWQNSSSTILARVNSSGEILSSSNLYAGYGVGATSMVQVGINNASYNSFYFQHAYVGYGSSSNYGVIGLTGSGATVYMSGGATLNVSGIIAIAGTVYAGYFTRTGASTTNVGLYATASGGTNNYAAIFDAGNVGIGTSSPGAQLQITSGAAATIGLIVKGASSQSANLQEWQNSSSVVKASISSTGTALFTKDASLYAVYLQSSSAGDNRASLVWKNSAGTNLWAVGPAILSGGSDQSMTFYDLVNTVTRLNIDSNGQVKVYVGTASTSTTTGALVVAGGIGVTNTSTFGNVVSITRGSSDALFLRSTSDSDLRATLTWKNLSGTSLWSIGPDLNASTEQAFWIYDPTASTVRLKIDASGRVSIGPVTATAALHIKAGTTAASSAPLKFTSGSLLTTAEAGAVEFLTDAFYGTITTGAARKTFAFLESPTFTGTVTAPTIVSTAVIRLKNYTVATLPAGTQGDTAFVTDALAPTFLTTVVGGGAVVTPVFYNGTNWVAQ